MEGIALLCILIPAGICVFMPFLIKSHIDTKKAQNRGLSAVRYRMAHTLTAVDFTILSFVITFPLLFSAFSGCKLIYPNQYGIKAVNVLFSWQLPSVHPGFIFLGNLLYCVIFLIPFIIFVSSRGFEIRDGFWYKLVWSWFVLAIFSIFTLSLLALTIIFVSGHV